jgi:hypothetical protein
VTPELAAYWADALMPILERNWEQPSAQSGYFKGTSVCLSALLAATRYEELLSLIAKAPFSWWHYRRWGVEALVAMGRKAEAIHYAEASRGRNDPGWQIAQACEGILLSSGLADEAYRRYALEANQATTNLATFRAIVKKYPHKQPHDVLRDLVSSTPGDEGKWFAAAKDSQQFDFAIELARRSPTDPRTLTRAARDYAEKQPGFALAVGLAALHWIARGYGYDITVGDVLDAYTAVTKAAAAAGASDQRVKELISELAVGEEPGSAFVKTILARHLSQ